MHPNRKQCGTTSNHPLVERSTAFAKHRSKRGHILTEVAGRVKYT